MQVADKRIIAVTAGQDVVECRDGIVESSILDPGVTIAAGSNGERNCRLVRAADREVAGKNIIAETAIQIIIECGDGICRAAAPPCFTAIPGARHGRKFYAAARAFGVNIAGQFIRARIAMQCVRESDYVVVVPAVAAGFKLTAVAARARRRAESNSAGIVVASNIAR